MDGGAPVNGIGFAALLLLAALFFGLWIAGSPEPTPEHIEEEKRDG